MAKRAAPRVVDPAARQLAALIAREVRARCGENSTFAERREMAAVVAKEMTAQLAAADEEK